MHFIIRDMARRVRPAAASLLIGFSLASAQASPETPQSPQTVELRGYGKVTAEFSTGRALFQCADAAHADILQGKLLADLLWDTSPQSKSGTEIEAKGRKLLVHEIPQRGAIAIGRLGNRVVALDGPDAASVVAAVAGDAVLADPQSLFKPQNDYPLYLDFLDLRAIKNYTHAFLSVRHEGLASHWPFLKKFDLGGISFNLSGGMFMGKSPAPGMIQYVDSDYEINEAARNGGMIVPSFSVGGEMPVWAANLFPESMMALSPTTLGTFTHFRESYGMPMSQREASGLGFLRDLLGRYKDNPAIGGWQFYDGPSGIEFDADYQRGTDFSPTGLASFRHYLKDVRHLDLQAVGTRYKNDPKAFKSWEEVLPLDEAALFGNLDETCLHLSQGEWQPAGAAVEPPTAAATPWLPIAFPPSEQMQTIPAADTFYRIRFDAGQWLAQNPGKEIYLVCGRVTSGQRGKTKVWLNGQSLGEQSTLTSGFCIEPAAVKVNGILKPGANELYLWVPKGKIFSPFFLTTHQPESYPTSDRNLNARYVDLIDWQRQDMVARHDDLFAVARSLDPDRPITMAGGSEAPAGECSDQAIRYGLTVQNTGREAYYQPWWARLGRVSGFYGSSEPSATTNSDINNPKSLNRLLGHILIDGDSSVILFWSLEDYIRIERESGWFTQNQRLLSLVGKSLPQTPEVAVLRSSKTLRYLNRDAETWIWDIGRGELNGTHHNWGYASERDLEKGLPRECKVLFDSGSTIMTPETVDEITKFVSNGGTFVALHNTGCNTPEEANAWPVSRLTGCKVLAGKGTGRIQFEKNLPAFKAWEGRQFAGEGTAVGWTGIDSAKDVSVRLQPTAPGVQVLAQWGDGSAAVTCRPLGKGRVICLGSTFWRDAADKDGVWIANNPQFLKQLVSDLGVTQQAEAASDQLWLDRAVTKNGAENWLIAFNTARSPVTSELKFKADAKPREVRDVATKTAVPFDYVEGWVVLPKVTFENTQTRVFATDRATLVGGLPVWWGEKTTYWPKTELPALAPAPVQNAASLGTLKIDPWKFLADRDGTAQADPQWTSASFNETAWGTLGTGPWNTLRDDLKDFTGVGLYRANFELPENWNGSAVDLCLFAGNPPCVLGQATFYVNGKKIEDARFLKEITNSGLGFAPSTCINPFLVPGKNQLAIAIKGGGTWADGTFSGFGGTVYLRKHQPLSPKTTLGDGWKLVQPDGKSTPVTLPVTKATGQHLACDFAVPATWTQGDLYLRLDTTRAWVRAIMVNGKSLMSPRFSEFGHSIELNLSSYVAPGQTCHLELWGKPYAEFSDPAKVPATREMDLGEAEIGLMNRTR